MPFSTAIQSNIEEWLTPVTLNIAVVHADVFLPPSLSPTQDELDDIGKGVLKGTEQQAAESIVYNTQL